ncbi:MAG: carboxymuconolactone decarboxylase family protein [Anaerolineae bacterium]|jgi:AhpD family alkylhydroperoxidase
MREFKHRLYCSLPEVLTDLRAAMSQRETLRSVMRGEGLDAAFRERLMLVVTAVNGCRYCSYVHAREALAEGISSDEIASLGKHLFKRSPPEEVPALLYAQQWAEADGRPDPAIRNRIRQRYGMDVLERIEAVLRMIRMGNLMGNTLDYILYRLSLGRWE